MENAVISSVPKGALKARTDRPGAWKAASMFGLGLIGAAMVAVFFAILFSGADPEGFGFVGTILAVTSVVMYLVYSRGRWAQGVAIAAAVALAAMIAPMVPEASFDSFFDFVPVSMCATGIAVILIGGVADLSRREAPAQAPAVLARYGAGVVAILAVAAALSALATFSGQETLTAAEREGLLPVVMRDTAFAPKVIKATEGEQVRIALKNSDAVIHDLRVSELDLKFQVKPGSEKAFAFTAPTAGKYAFDCSLHPNMKGVLEVAAK